MDGHDAFELDAPRVADVADWRDLRRRGWGHETGDGRQQGDEDHEAGASAHDGKRLKRVTAAWPSGRPRAHAARLVDPDPGEQTFRGIRRWEVLVGPQHHLGQLLEKRGRAALFNAGRSGDRQVGRLLPRLPSARIVTATRGSRRMLRVFWYSVRWAETSSSPSGVDSRAIHTTVTWGCHRR